ncbi:hypothetical protein FQR65_LT15161 [Abscondita terminalis]|nr:hypothetical protein FQR65_LT15161 [Abscondita terminalis]
MYKKNENKRIYFKATLNSLANLENSKISSLTRVKRNNDETLVEATAKGIYSYWLNQDDLNEIVRLEYNNYANLVKGNRKYEILASISDLNTHIEDFLLKTKKLNENRLTLIIQQENLHWVTLVISYKEKNHIAYYTDSKNYPLPSEYYQLLLDKFKIQPISLSPGFQQQKEDYECGLWALANAANLNKMLDENQSIYWLINQLQQSRNKAYFERKRHYFSEKLRTDPGWRLRHPSYSQQFNSEKESLASSSFSLRRISSESSDESDSKRLKLMYKYEKEKVTMLLEVFVESFMSTFSKNLGKYYLIAKGERLTDEALKNELKTGLTGALLGMGISQSLIGSIPSLVASLRFISGKYYISKDKAQKITKIFSEIKPGSLSTILSEAAVDIFYSYENQFMLLTDKAGERIAMEKLAEDAVGRVFNYIVKSTEIVTISEELITQGVIQGPSEKFFDPSVKSARLLVSGNIIQDKSKNKVNTANLYEMVGLIVINIPDQPNKYYANKNYPRTRYGYRRLLNWEQETNGELKKSLENQYVEEQISQPENMFQFNSKIYDEVADAETKVKEAQRILAKIEHRNSDHVFEPQHKQVNKMSILFDLRKPISNFSGRIELLKTLHHTLRSERTTAIVPVMSSLTLSTNPSSSSSSQATSGAPFSITGLGGIGKTQLALRYAELYAKDYDYNILWIGAETKENLSRSFHKLASNLQLPILDSYGQKKDLEDIVNSIYEYFSDRKSLFIFDNVENYHAIVAYLPKVTLGNKPTLLITSRYNNWQNVASVLSLGAFTLQETEELIKKSLDISDSAQNEKIRELNLLLQGLPLALQQAFAYIKLMRITNINFSLDSYINLYKEKCKTLLSFEFWHYSNDPYLQPVYTTWLITLEKIKSYSLGEDAIHFLHIMSYLDPDNISIETFYGLNQISSGIKLYDLGVIIHLLSSYSMINRGGHASKFTIHRLLQQVIRLHLEQDKPLFKKVIKQTQKLLVYTGFKDDEENIFHYLHFLLYMSEHTELDSSFLFDNPQKIFFDNLRYQHIKYCAYFIELAYLKFPKEKYLKFIGNAIAYYIKLGLTFFLAETLNYLEKKWLEGVLPKENIKYVIQYVENLKDTKYALKRLSSLPSKKEMQKISVRSFYEFKMKIFGDLFDKYDKCLSHSLKRSICSVKTVQEKIKEIKNLKIKSHLKKLGSFSRTIGSGLMAKDTLMALLQGEFSQVAINFGLLTSSTLLGKISNGMLFQGRHLAGDTRLLEKDLGLENKSALRILFNKDILSVGKRQFLGKTLQVASPFVARATSIFFLYNLKNEIHAYEMGDKAILPDIISNGIIVGIDGIEAGVEGAEFFGVITGIAEFTGPIGEGVALLAWLGSELYTAGQQVEVIEKYVSLSRTEQVVQFLRAFFHLSPSEYLQVKAKNEQLVAKAILFLKKHTDIKHYIFSSFHSENVLYNDSRVFLDEKRLLALDTDSNPDELKEGNLFCLSGSPLFDYVAQISNYRFRYLCQHALGIEYSLNRTANVTLIALGPGNQEVLAPVDTPTVFIVENGQKLYKGGDKVNVFDLQGNSTTGLLYGGQGSNILNLDQFHPKKSDYLLIDAHKFLCGKISNVIQSVPLFCSDKEDKIQLHNINQIRGRNNQQEVIYLNKDLREIDGGGGKNNEHPDILFITDRSYQNPRLILRNNTVIVYPLNTNVNSVDYLIPPTEVGVAQVRLHLQETIQHRFFFQTAIQNIQVLTLKNNTLHILLNGLDSGNTNVKTFALNISDTVVKLNNNQIKSELDFSKNISYFFKETEMKLLNNDHVYLQEQTSTNNTIDEQISLFSEMANRLEKTFSIKFSNNIMLSIGQTKHEIFYINGLFESHLVGNGGENVYIIVPTNNTVFPLASVTLYDKLKEDDNESTELRNTLDLLIFPRLFRVSGDLFLTLINAIYSPSRYSKSLDNFHSLVTIRLKNAVLDNENWYQKLDIFIDDSIPKNIAVMENEEDEIWNLQEAPLVFTDDKQIIVITDKDIGEQAEITLLRNIGQFIFLRTETDLILTNIPNPSFDICSIIFIGYKIPEMKKKILSATLRSFDHKFQFQDYQEKITHAYFFDLLSSEGINTSMPSYLNLMDTIKPPVDRETPSKQILHRNDYIKKYQNSLSKKNTAFRIKKRHNQKNNEKQASRLIFTNKSNSKKKCTVHTTDKQNYHKQSIQKKSNFNLKKQTSPMPLVQHNLKLSKKSGTENLAAKKNKFLKNTFFQNKKISLVASAASTLINHKEKIKTTVKAQPRLGYQQGKSKSSQHKPNQYPRRLSRTDALANFNAPLMLIQLMAKIPTPILPDTNPKLNKISMHGMSHENLYRYAEEHPIIPVEETKTAMSDNVGFAAAIQNYCTLVNTQPDISLDGIQNIVSSQNLARENSAYWLDDLNPLVIKVYTQVKQFCNFMVSYVRRHRTDS